MFSSNRNIKKHKTKDHPETKHDSLNEIFPLNLSNYSIKSNKDPENKKCSSAINIDILEKQANNPTQSHIHYLKRSESKEDLMANNSPKNSLHSIPMSKFAQKISSNEQEDENEYSEFKKQKSSGDEDNESLYNYNSDNKTIHAREKKAKKNTKFHSEGEDVFYKTESNRYIAYKKPQSQRDEDYSTEIKYMLKGIKEKNRNTNEEIKELNKKIDASMQLIAKTKNLMAEDNQKAKKTIESLEDIKNKNQAIEIKIISIQNEIDNIKEEINENNQIVISIKTQSDEIKSKMDTILSHIQEIGKKLTPVAIIGAGSIFAINLINAILSGINTSGGTTE